MNEFFKSDDLKRLEQNAKFGDISFRQYIKENNSLLIQGINKELGKLFYIDLEQMDPKFKEGLMAWILTVNKPRIDAGYPVMLSLGMLKRSPFWRYIPLRTHNLNSDTSVKS